MNTTSEASYPFGRNIQSLKLNKIANVDIRNLPELRTIEINGFSLTYTNNIDIMNTGNMPLRNIYIRSTTDKVGNIYISPIDRTPGGGAYVGRGDCNLYIDCEATINTSLKIDPGSNFNTIDLSERYAPSAGISMAHFYGTFGTLTLVIRANTLIPSQTASAWNDSNRRMYVYVPDDLVDAYKVATNWNQTLITILPLSSYSPA